MKIAGVSDKAVQDKTGKNWQNWIEILEERRADEMTHTEIAKMLRDEFGVSPWWAQKITGGYEQTKMGREKHEMPGGFEISRSRTWSIPFELIYDAWVQDARRQQWLPDKVRDIRETTPDRSLWMEWHEDSSRVNVRFGDRGGGKTTLTVQHIKISDKGAADQLKKFWEERLEALHDLLAS